MGDDRFNPYAASLCPPAAEADVVLQNDDINTIGYVVLALRRVFGYGRCRATWLT